MRNGEPFGLRKYQRESVDAFHVNGTIRGGGGVIVLPCGAGKTVVPMGAALSGARPPLHRQDS